MSEKMKTNKIMLRDMGIYEIHQRSIDSKFDANHLLEQWNNTPGNQKKQMAEFLRLKSTKEYMDAITEDEGEQKLVINVKGRMSKSGRIPDRVHMHPHLFIDFAMWLNPRFKQKVVKFVFDQLIEFRNDAGVGYSRLMKSVARFPEAVFPEVARALNCVVYESHEEELRQRSTVDQIKELAELQRNLIFALDTGLYKTYEEFLQAMRNQWLMKWRPGQIAMIR